MRGLVIQPVPRPGGRGVGGDDEVTLGDEVAVFSAPLVRTPGGFTVDIPGQSLVIEHPEDDDFAAEIASMRVDMDLNQPDYRNAWHRLAQGFGWSAETTIAWDAAVDARERRTADDVLAMWQNMPRTVSTLQLMDASGNVIDAIAIDSRGEAATALGTALAEWLITTWPPQEPGDPGLTARQSKPDPAAFVAYYDGRSVPGGGAWGTPTTAVVGGSLEQLAASSLPATLTGT